MGKGIYEGLRKAGDPMLGRTVIVIGGGWRRTSKKRSKQARSKEGLSQKDEGPGPKKEQ